MTATRRSGPPLGTRIALAFSAFFRLLGNAAFARDVLALRSGSADSDGDAARSARAGAAAAALQAPPVPSSLPPVILREASPEIACQVLALLQREGRLIDFVEEDLAGADDAAVGAAARLVHDGCRRALREYFTIRPIRDEEEGSVVTVAAPIDAARIHLAGHVAGTPPFSGTLQHRGWHVADVKLPKLTEHHDPRVLAQAEIELGS